jgi:NAD(P)H-flavin reductase
VTNLLPRIPFHPEHTIALVCGPEIMMKVMARELGALGVDRNDTFVSLERNMACAIGLCGHCQFGPDFLCRDGPVVPFARVGERMTVEEL